MNSLASGSGDLGPYFAEMRRFQFFFLIHLMGGIRLRIRTYQNASLESDKLREEIRSLLLSFLRHL